MNQNKLPSVRIMQRRASPIYMVYPITSDNRGAVAVIKAINRRARAGLLMCGAVGSWGVDFATWAAYYPRTAAVYQAAAETVAGRPGRFMPRF